MLRSVLWLALVTLVAMMMMGCYWKGYVDSRAALLGDFPSVCGGNQ